MDGLRKDGWWSGQDEQEVLLHMHIFSSCFFFVVILAVECLSKNK